MTNLAMLSLWGNQIADVSPLAGLINLPNLDLSDNQIVDVSPLASLTNLTGLGLSTNHIRDVSALATLTELRAVDLGRNQIRDISTLTGLTSLTWLVIGPNPLSKTTYCLGILERIVENNPGIELVNAVTPFSQNWVETGEPDCWCNLRQCHGDADDKAHGSPKTGLYYVGPSDLNILVSAWLVKELPHGPGIASIPNGVCADFAHDAGGSEKTGLYRVGPSDLNVLVANWLVREPPKGPGIDPNCPDWP